MPKNKKFHPIYLMAILYVVMTYLIPVIFMLTASDQRPLVSSLFMLLPIALGIVNLVITLTCFAKVSRKQFLICSMIVKYALIPFYAVGGLCIAVSLLLAFTPVVVMIFIGPMVAAMLSVMGWIILAGAASYPIAYLVQAKRAGVYGKTFSVVSGILQFFFVADVVFVTVMAICENRFMKKQGRLGMK